MNEKRYRIRRTNVSFRVKRTRCRSSLQFQSTSSDTRWIVSPTYFLRIVIDQEDGGKFYPSKVIDTISRLVNATRWFTRVLRFEREKKSSIFVQNFLKKKKITRGQKIRCTRETTPTLVRDSIRIRRRKFVPFDVAHDGAPFIPRSFVKTKFLPPGWTSPRSILLFERKIIGGSGGELRYYAV